MFGLLFDIDGVLVRGKNVLPSAPKAFRMLVDDHGKFKVPTVFVTNAGNSLRYAKAIQLSEWLGVEIDEDQVVMAHSPLRLFDDFMDRHVLVNGQGPVYEIAKNLGFRNITTMEELRIAYRKLDCVDHIRREKIHKGPIKDIAPIEALLLFGEPIRWETSLQLILDVLMTEGHLDGPYTLGRGRHLPVLACNMDLMWMSEAHLPRFGHGAFLRCLEALFHKYTGEEMAYTALVGKPSEITYYHAETMLQEHARKIGVTQPLTTLYAVGDNVDTDIYGMNLYAAYVRRRRAEGEARMCGARGFQLASTDFKGLTAQRCFSVLVETGVYTEAAESLSKGPQYIPRDFLPVLPAMKVPSMTVPCVLKAMQAIFGREGWA